MKFHQTEEYRLIEQIKSQVDDIINLLLIGTCQRQRVLEDAEQLLETVDQLEKILQK